MSWLMFWQVYTCIHSLVSPCLDRALALHDGGLTGLLVAREIMNVTRALRAASFPRETVTTRSGQILTRPQAEEEDDVRNGMILEGEIGHGLGVQDIQKNQSLASNGVSLNVHLVHVHALPQKSPSLSWSLTSRILVRASLDRILLVNFLMFLSLVRAPRRCYKYGEARRWDVHCPEIQ